MIGASPAALALTRRGMLAAGAALAAIGIARPGPAHAGTPAAGAADRLWYRQPAGEWTEALSVGNGRIGAMVFGGTDSERLQLNEDSLWSGGPYAPVNPEAQTALPRVRRLIEQGRYAEAQDLANAHMMARPISQMAYQTLGDLTVSMPGLDPVESGSYLRELDLDSALATTRFTAGGTRWQRRVLASPDRQVIAIHLSADRPGAVRCRIALSSPLASRATAGGAELLLAGQNGGSHGVPGALRFAARALVAAPGGSVRADGDALEVAGADSLTILLAMATSYRRFDDVSGDPLAITAAQIAAAAGADFATLAEETAAAHRRLYRRARLALGETPAAALPTDERIVAAQHGEDPGLAALYFHYGRYLLICSSRPGSQPANLQGIWNDSTDPPWGSKYTININTEMNYWPAHSTGLSELAQPLVELVRDLSVTGAHTARTMYGARGWVAHHNTDLWRATAPIDGAQWGLWPTGGAWLCNQLWEHYDYHRDLDYLRSIYPLMRGAALFFLDTLQTDPASGRLVTNPSVSPENTHPGGAALCAGPAMDQQILRDLFARTGQAARLLGEDTGLAADLAAAHDRLAPDRIGAQGQLQEWQQDWDAAAPEPHHRHVSHLYGLYPSWQINPDDTPDLAAAARKSLEMRGDESTGWATAWRINLWARLREGDHAHRILRFLLGPGRTYPNMFDAHPPFQIDGNFGGTAAIAEMLMQSRGDEILLLPALPTAWAEGEIRGLRARGGCVVDLAWHDHTLAHAVLTPSIAGARRVRLGGRVVSVSLVPGRPLRLLGPELTA